MSYNRTLPPTDQLDRIEVVLVAPRNPLNIGAAARAMANFGFSQLTVVAPYEPHWREAQSAVGAEDLLRTARVCASLKEALADCTLAFGTGTLTYRAPEQPVLLLPDLVPVVQAELARPASRIALLFGPEKHGLTREDLALCQRLLVIPTSSWQPSMNLGQAVAVCLYEIGTRLSPPAQNARAEAAPLRTWKSKAPATSAELDRLAGLIAETMQAAHYSPATMNKANRHDLDLLLRRLNLGARDTTRLVGFFRRILWRLRQ